MKNGKFTILYETIFNRYQQGSGFLEGDVVKLKKDYKSLDTYKSLTDSIKVRLEDASKSGFNLRLGRLHTPNNSAGALGINKYLPATHADLYEEKSPGNFGNLVTIPIDLLEVVDTGVNLPPVSSNNKRDDGDYQKPGKWTPRKGGASTKEQDEVRDVQNYVKKGSYELATKNKAPSVGANSYDDNKPSKFKPLPKNKKLVKEGLEGVYEMLLTEEESEFTSDGDPNAAEPSQVMDETRGQTVNIIKGQFAGKQGIVKAEFDDYVHAIVDGQAVMLGWDEIQQPNAAPTGAVTPVAPQAPQAAPVGMAAEDAAVAAPDITENSPEEIDWASLDFETPPHTKASGGIASAPEDRETDTKFEEKTPVAPEAPTPDVAPTAPEQDSGYESFKQLEGDQQKLIDAIKAAKEKFRGQDGNLESQAEQWINYITPVVTRAKAEDPQLFNALKSAFETIKGTNAPGVEQ